MGVISADARIGQQGASSIVTFLSPPPPSTICVRQSTGVLLHAKGTTIFSVLCHHGMARSTCTTRAPTWVMSFASLADALPWLQIQKKYPYFTKGLK
jgi:hypothetical protein